MSVVVMLFVVLCCDVVQRVCCPYGPLGQRTQTRMQTVCGSSIMVCIPCCKTMYLGGAFLCHDVMTTCPNGPN